MKQKGNTVKSTSESLFGFKGKVQGTQLKGNLKLERFFSFAINISQDHQSFKGKIDNYWGTQLLKGTRRK